MSVAPDSEAADVATVLQSADDKFWAKSVHCLLNVGSCSDFGEDGKRARGWNIDTIEEHRHDGLRAVPAYKGPEMREMNYADPLKLVRMYDGRQGVVENDMLEKRHLT